MFQIYDREEIDPLPRLEEIQTRLMLPGHTDYRMILQVILDSHNNDDQRNMHSSLAVVLNGGGMRSNCSIDK